MITEAQENAAAEARARARQDKRNPFLIHMDDARLIPNVEKLRTHPKYRVFTGPSTASLEERKAWLASMGGGRRIILDSGADLPPFDIGKATVDELVAFAASEYGTALDPKKHHNTLRAELRKLAEMHGSLASDAKRAADDLS